MIEPDTLVTMPAFLPCRVGAAAGIDDNAEMVVSLCVWMTEDDDPIVFGLNPEWARVIAYDILDAANEALGRDGDDLVPAG